MATCSTQGSNPTSKSSCNCKDCFCDGCASEECDCETCELTCRDYDQSDVEKRHTGDNASELHDAIVRKDKAEICKILEQKNVNLRTVYENGNRALHLVFQNFEEKDVIEILTSFCMKKVNLYFKNKDKETVFHIAVAKRMKKAIYILKKYGFKNEMMHKPSNPLPHFFVENESRKFLKLSNPQADDTKSVTRESIEIESASFVEWLISIGFDQNTRGESALHLAINRNLQHILPTLLKYSIDIDFISENSKRTLLHLYFKVNNACMERSINCRPQVWSIDFAQRHTEKIVKTLLENGVSVNTVDKFGDTALHIAARTNVQMNIFEMLLKRFTNVDHRDRFGRTVLHEVTANASWAASESEVDIFLNIVRSLLIKDSDVNTKDKKGLTPVYELVKAKNLRAFELLKEINADFSVMPFGCNLLHILAMKKPDDKTTDESQEAIFDLLISKGCDVNATTNGEESPLHFAVKDQNIAIIRKLIAHGAKVNCKDEQEMTPLYIAVNIEAVEVAKLLLNNGANVNVKYLDARPLHLAAATNSSKMVKLLLYRGAYVHARDKLGETAVSCAILYRKPDNVKELIKYGANINDTSVVHHIEISYRHNYHEILVPVLEHWLKLDYAKLPCIKAYNAFTKGRVSQKSQDKCMVEVELMKNTDVTKMLSLYDFLQMNPNRRCTYAYCDTVITCVRSPDFGNKFPKYGNVILGHCSAARARHALVDKAKALWLKVTKIILPDVCIEHIFSFISNEVLIDMIEG